MYKVSNLKENTKIFNIPMVNCFYKPDKNKMNCMFIGNEEDTDEIKWFNTDVKHISIDYPAEMVIVRDQMSVSFIRGVCKIMYPDTLICESQPLIFTRYREDEPIICETNDGERYDCHKMKEKISEWKDLSVIRFKEGADLFANVTDDGRFVVNFKPLYTDKCEVFQKSLDCAI